MEIPFPAIHLYVALALAATLASVVATHLRSPQHMDKKPTLWLAIGTCVLLILAWGHLITVLFGLVQSAWRADPLVCHSRWHLTTHLLVIAAMLPVVCVTVIRSWIAGVKDSVQLRYAP